MLNNATYILIFKSPHSLYYFSYLLSINYCISTWNFILSKTNYKFNKNVSAYTTLLFKLKESKVIWTLRESTAIINWHSYFNSSFEGEGGRRGAGTGEGRRKRWWWWRRIKRKEWRRKGGERTRGREERGRQRQRERQERENQHSLWHLCQHDGKDHVHLKAEFEELTWPRAKWKP